MNYLHDISDHEKADAIISSLCVAFKSQIQLILRDRDPSKVFMGGWGIRLGSGDNEIVLDWSIHAGPPPDRAIRLGLELKEGDEIPMKRKVTESKG